MLGEFVYGYSNNLLDVCAARYSFVITPINYNLALVNIFVAATNIYQLSRIARLRMEKKDGVVEEKAA